MRSLSTSILCEDLSNSPSRIWRPSPSCVASPLVPATRSTDSGTRSRSASLASRAAGPTSGRKRASYISWLHNCRRGSRTSSAWVHLVLDTPKTGRSRPGSKVTNHDAGFEAPSPSRQDVTWLVSSRPCATRRSLPKRSRIRLCAATAGNPSKPSTLSSATSSTNVARWTSTSTSITPCVCGTTP